MDIDKYIEELKQDTEVNAFNIKEVQMRLPAIKHKWSGRYIRLKQELFALQKKREAKKKELMSKVAEASPVKLSDIVAERTVESAESLKDIDTSIQNIKLCLELLEKSEKILSSMSFDLSNMINLMKLEQM